ncbi:MAG: hypothetical protein ACLVL7_11320 [Anaerotruncus massiliensis (ex Togo et al. 2019)]
MPVESEHSALSACIGAEAAGARGDGDLLLRACADVELLYVAASSACRSPSRASTGRFGRSTSTTTTAI